MFRKKKNQVKRPKKISEEVANAILSGEDWLQSTQILQALDPVKDLLNSQISELKGILVEYRDKGGTIDLDERSDGYDVVSTWNDITWKYVFDASGDKVDMIIRDSTPGQTSAETLRAVKTALEAAYEIPRREFALSELERIEQYIENDNALAGLEKVREILSVNENVVYSIATAERLSEAVSPLMELKE